MNNVDEAFKKGFSAGKGYGAALAITSVLEVAGESGLGDSSSFRSFLQGFEDGKKQSALMVIAPLLVFFDVTEDDDEEIEKAASFLGYSASEIKQSLMDLD